MLRLLFAVLFLLPCVALAEPHNLGPRADTATDFGAQVDIVATPDPEADLTLVRGELWAEVGFLDRFSAYLRLPFASASGAIEASTIGNLELGTAMRLAGEGGGETGHTLALGLAVPTASSEEAETLVGVVAVLLGRMPDVGASLADHVAVRLGYAGRSLLADAVKVGVSSGFDLALPTGDAAGEPSSFWQLGGLVGGALGPVEIFGEAGLVFEVTDGTAYGFVGLGLSVEAAGVRPRLGFSLPFGGSLSVGDHVAVHLGFDVIAFEATTTTREEAAP